MTSIYLRVDSIEKRAADHWKKHFEELEKAGKLPEKLICCDNRVYEDAISLTLSKVYKVVEYWATDLLHHISVKDDNGDERWFAAFRFLPEVSDADNS